ncbi:MAG: corrinoid protein [Bacillota bacterium]
MRDHLEQITTAVIDGEEEIVARLVQKAVDQGVSPKEIVNGGLVRGMDLVGARFKAGEFFVPEVLIAAKAMSCGLFILKPLLAEGDVPRAGKVVIGTVKGDLHDIGKNLVAMMLEGSGFEVVDLGIDVSAEEFAKAVRVHEPDILGMSALLTTTMSYARDVLDLLKEEGLRSKVVVFVGGAPVTQQYAYSIGADGYSPDAAGAVEMAKATMRKRSK